MPIASNLLLLAHLMPLSFPGASAQTLIARNDPSGPLHEPHAAKPAASPPRKKTMAPPAYSPAKKDPALKLGLAIRGRYDLRFNDRSKAGRNRTSNHLSFDTAIVTADYDSAVLFGSAQYRFYGGSFIYGKESGYKNYPGEISFPLYGYLGAKINKTSQVTFGLAPVPFDDRWWGASFLNSIGFVYGLEEVYNLGAVLGHNTDKWSFDLGFFPTTAPNAMGRSADSARYSVNMTGHGTVLPNGSDNDERYMTVGRARYQISSGTRTNLAVTGSFWLSTIHNYSTRRNGQRRAFALSLRYKTGPWRFKLMGVRQDMDLRNPGSNDIVTVGDYDSVYNIASRATIGFIEGARTIDTGKLPVKLDLFVNYANVWKDSSYHAPNTQRLSLGAFWTDKATNRFRVWSEFYLGRNDPNIGAGQFTNGAGQGGDNKYKSSFLVIFGYYFQ